MAKKIKKSIPWFLVLILIGTMVGLGLNIAKPQVKADTSTTSVAVANTAPSFTAGPAEDPASLGTSPTNVGSNVTFKATASDPNTDNYYLAVCTTDAVTAGASGGAPTCNVGTRCVSTSTADDVQASCTYTTLVGDAESNAWYAFVCDAASSSQACSASSQGTGDSGSPFKVNHRPSFTVVGDSPDPSTPGATVTITTTASDADVDTAADTVKLYVCKAQDGTSSGCGVGGTWCSAALTISNPTCNFAMTTPSEGVQNYYPYVFDSHNFDASGAPHATLQTNTVSNVAPAVSGVTLNSGSDITLTENTTTNVVAAATVTDNNGCGDILKTTASIYRSGTGWSGCQGTDNANNCYALESCTLTGGSCTGGSDLDSTFTCTVAIQYHADPTDIGTKYPTENWLTTASSSDETFAGTTQITTGVEMNSLTALDVTTTIAYGSLAPSQQSSSDQTTTVTATGNVGLDAEYSGTNMTSGGNTILVSQQKYDLTTSASADAWSDMDYALSVSATERELNCAKTISSGSPATAGTYWRIQIPSEQVVGSYSGTNTIGAKVGETVNW